MQWAETAPWHPSLSDRTRLHLGKERKGKRRKEEGGREGKERKRKESKGSKQRKKRNQPTNLGKTEGISPFCGEMFSTPPCCSCACSASWKTLAPLDFLTTCQQRLEALPRSRLVQVQKEPQTPSIGTRPQVHRGTRPLETPPRTPPLRSRLCRPRLRRRVPTGRRPLRISLSLWPPLPPSLCVCVFVPVSDSAFRLGCLSPTPCLSVSCLSLPLVSLSLQRPPRLCLSESLARSLS